MATAARQAELLLDGGASSVPLVIPDASLCTSCGVNPRAGKGACTKCVACLRAAAERYRQERAALASPGVV